MADKHTLYHGLSVPAAQKRAARDPGTCWQESKASAMMIASSISEVRRVRAVRTRRRGFVDLRNITIGDWIVLVASLMTVVSLFMPWFVTSIPRPHGEWAFTYSEVAAVVVIVFFLATVFLIVYPALSPDLGAPPLPFATPVVLLFMGAVLLLLFFFELGKYSCIACTGVNRGFGVWVAAVAAVIYIIGAIIKWGTRSVRG